MIIDGKIMYDISRFPKICTQLTSKLRQSDNITLLNTSHMFLPYYLTKFTRV